MSGEGKQTERAAVLTAADLMALDELMERKIKAHICRYDMEPKDMALVADLVGIYKETRSILLKALVGGILTVALIIGIWLVKQDFITVPKIKIGG